MSKERDRQNAIAGIRAMLGYDAPAKVETTSVSKQVLDVSKLKPDDIATLSNMFKRIRDGGGSAKVDSIPAVNESHSEQAGIENAKVEAE